MDIQAYINSGILEQYCLGLLNADEEAMVLKMCAAYPEIKNELTGIETTLEKTALAHAVAPQKDIKQSILNAIEFAQEISLDNLPATSNYSNYQAWLDAVEHLIPNQPFDAFFAAPLRSDKHIEQTLVISTVNVPQETHNDVIESFFILQGECVCMVGNKSFKLTPGDFLEIPLHEVHDVTLQSPHVIAILQHRFI